jgi:hypothetical protein
MVVRPCAIPFAVTVSVQRDVLSVGKQFVGLVR